MWVNRTWIGSLFTAKARGEEMLRQYASVLTTVEGNQTFYGVPSRETFERWRDQVPEHFRFCFKFPREVSHGGSLMSATANRVAETFLDRVASIADRVGVLSLQLPPRFHPGRFGELGAFLQGLPQGLAYAVEPRHPDWFDGADHEQKLDDLLRRRGMNRAMFHTRVVHALLGKTDAVRRAQAKKPKNPDRFVATASYPFLRYAGAPDVGDNEAALEPVVSAVAAWIRAGRTPFVFIHTPGDRDVPHLCRRFHQHLREALPHVPIGDMPPWPGEQTGIPDEQLELF